MSKAFLDLNETLYTCAEENCEGCSDMNELGDMS